MKKYLLAYISYIEEQLNDPNADYEKLRKEHLVQIEFMQHERLVHLIVTCLIATLLIMCIIGMIIIENIGLIIISIFFICLIIPYIKHYFFLENNVQKLYNIYNDILEKMSEKPDSGR